MEYLIEKGGTQIMRGKLYRWLVIFAHKHNWHHVRVSGPLPDGKYMRWCHWCGMRDTFYKLKAGERLIEKGI